MAIEKIKMGKTEPSPRPGGDPRKQKPLKRAIKVLSQQVKSFTKPKVAGNAEGRASEFYKGKTLKGGDPIKIDLSSLFPVKPSKSKFALPSMVRASSKAAKAAVAKTPVKRGGR